VPDVHADAPATEAGEVETLADAVDARGGTDVRLPDDVVTDTQPDLPPKTVPIGKPCAVNPDCGDGTCLSWPPGGYCTIKGCDAHNPCPEGSVCSPMHFMGEEFGACLKACDMPGDCNLDAGYVCDRDGTCWNQEGGLVLHAEGDSCILDTQCAADNEAVCYPEYYGDQPTGYTDGYCIIWNCKMKGCPSGMKCVDVNDDSTACFTSCAGDDDCRTGYQCTKPANVCVAACSTSFECPQKHVCMNSFCLEGRWACSVANPAGWCPDKQWCDMGACKPMPFACGEDTLLEPNDTMEQAATLETDRLFGLKVCGGDEDWYKVHAPAGLLTEVKLTFSNKAGNLDMLVYTASGDFIRARWIEYPYQGLLVADFDVSNEAVSFYSPDVDREYYIKVVGSDDATNTYGLVTRRYPFEDGELCPTHFADDDCKGLPAGILKLYQFPEPDPDDPYGGDAYHFETVSSYKWARRETIMLIRHALRKTRLMYPGTESVGIIDACQEDGVTPGYNIGQPRHCRTCHDEGGNIDLAYFATDGNNMAKTVCGPNGTNVTPDGMQCTPAAETGHIVDLERQVYFMSLLFESERMRAIGVDPEIAKALYDKADEMHAAGEISDAGWLGIKSKFGLWATHHNHIHISLLWWDHIYPGQ